jgi:hypothetical protein
MDTIPIYHEELCFLEWDIFLTTEFERLGLNTQQQKTELVHSYLSAYLDTLNYDQLYLLRLSLLLEHNHQRHKVGALLDLIAAQFAILETRRDHDGITPHETIPQSYSGGLGAAFSLAQAPALVRLYARKWA